LQTNQDWQRFVLAQAGDEQRSLGAAVPGIAGLITKRPRRWAEPQLLKMVAALRHEPFYRVGTWIDESRGIYAGWAAIENSFADGMPLSDRNRDMTLIFSGEVHGLESAAETCDKSHAASLLPLAIEDPQFVSHLDGLFHGLLVDGRAASVTLFNDRYGMHRLCYHESNEAFYFAAEAKAILAARPDLCVPSPQALGEFLACSCVLENRTIFKDIAVIPAGSRWTFRNGASIHKEKYFDPKEWEEQVPLDNESYYQGLRESLAKTLPHYFDGPQRTAVALTGGMDTRVILAQHTPTAGSLPTYTFGGMFRDCRDVKIARKVADTCGQTHDVITVDNDFLSNFPRYAERTVYLTEGGVDVYRASDLYVSEKARLIAPAKVVGTYGSEIVRHAVMFKPMLPADGLFHGEMASDIRRAYDTYSAIRRVHPVTFAAFRQSPWYHHGVLALEQTQLTVRSPFLANDFVAAVYRAPATLSASDDVRLRLIGDGSPELRRIPSDRGVGGRLDPLTSALAKAYFEFTFKAEYACDYGMPQWAARMNSWISPLRLDRVFLGRHKFLHYRLWYRDALAAYVQEILLDPRTLSRPFWQRSKVEAMVNGHVRGHRNSTTAIHKLLTMELLFRQFFDGQSRNYLTEPTVDAFPRAS
jgi:asparagine synthase (glutamine-hydrolysing)